MFLFGCKCSLVNGLASHQRRKGRICLLLLAENNHAGKCAALAMPKRLYSVAYFNQGICLPLIIYFVARVLMCIYEMNYHFTIFGRVALDVQITTPLNLFTVQYFNYVFLSLKGLG